MKKKLLGIIMTVIGALTTAYFGLVWYAETTYVYEIASKEGEIHATIGTAVTIILTVISVAVLAAGIYFWVRGSKKAKA